MNNTISVIIPARNEERVIGDCLESLKAVELGGGTLEIIVVDNGSSDATADIARSHGAVVLVKKNGRISALRNYGVAHSQGDILGFVDADCLVAKTWAVNALKCMKEQSADAVGSHYAIPEDAGWIGKTIESMQSKKTGTEVNYIPAGNIIVKRSVFSTLGGFDESLETNEDVDFCHRLKASGFKLFSDFDIKSVHLGTPDSIKEVFRKQVWHGTNTITIFLRDLGKLRNFRIVLYSVLNAILITGVIAGLGLFIILGPTVLLTSLILYLILNLVVSFVDWKKAGKNFMGIYFYMMIYGAARSVSTYKWLLGAVLNRRIA